MLAFLLDFPVNFLLITLNYKLCKHTYLCAKYTADFIKQN